MVSIHTFSKPGNVQCHAVRWLKVQCFHRHSRRGGVDIDIAMRTRKRRFCFCERPLRRKVSVSMQMRPDQRRRKCTSSESAAAVRPPISRRCECILRSVPFGTIQRRSPILLNRLVIRRRVRSATPSDASRGACRAVRHDPELPPIPRVCEPSLPFNSAFQKLAITFRLVIGKPTAPKAVTYTFPYTASLSARRSYPRVYANGRKAMSLITSVVANGVRCWTGSESLTL